MVICSVIIDVYGLRALKNLPDQVFPHPGGIVKFWGGATLIIHFSSSLGLGRGREPSQRSQRLCSCLLDEHWLMELICVLPNHLNPWHWKIRESGYLCGLIQGRGWPWNSQGSKVIDYLVFCPRPSVKMTGTSTERSHTRSWDSWWTCVFRSPSAQRYGRSYLSSCCPETTWTHPAAYNCTQNVVLGTSSGDGETWRDIVSLLSAKDKMNQSHITSESCLHVQGVLNRTPGAMFMESN